MGPEILLVDDEKSLVKGLQKSLEQENYVVWPAYEGREAWELFMHKPFDLVILDLMLPGIDGLTLCHRMREKSDVPIIMLTAKGDDVDKIVGLEMGADDYLAKPFNTRELLARIKAVLRRFSKNEQTGRGKLVLGELTVDLLNHRVYLNQQDVDLTAKEFDLLALMAKNPGRIFTREQLLRQVWGLDYIGEDRTVDVHVRRLREKIEVKPDRPCYVLTKWGVGYYFAAKEQEA